MQAFVEVCERLGGFDHRTTAEYADGFLTAMAVGARAVPLDECLAKMAGDAWERAFADPDDRAAAEQALRARIAVIEDELDAEALWSDPDTLRLSPYMLEWTDEDRAKIVEAGEAGAEDANALVTGADWARGFFAAFEDFAAHWPDVQEEERGYIEELLAQSTALLYPLGSEELREHLEEFYKPAEGEGAAGEADRERLIDSACFAVQDLRVWAVDAAPVVEPRRVEKTPGRNDPCPCGSGKKYKKCHGAG